MRLVEEMGALMMQSVIGVERRKAHRRLTAGGKSVKIVRATPVLLQFHVVLTTSVQPDTDVMTDS